VFSGTTDAATTPCTDGKLDCLVPPGCSTTLSGTVYDPAGVNPLYNAVVYVPNDPAGALPAIKVGTNTCASCDVSIGDYVTVATSGPDGKFTLTGVPAATHVPLVVQIGKWRREVFLPEVKACTDATLTAQQTRLPASHTEGDIPQMALVTGGADNLGCFLKGIGLADSEYTSPTGGGRLHIYQGLPASSPPTMLGPITIPSIGGSPGLSGGTAGDCTTDNAACVWHTKANFEKYDIVMLSCEGNPYDPDDKDSDTPTNKSPAAKQALHDWLDEGGKVFSTHYQYTWFKNSPSADFKGVATWLGSSGANNKTSNFDVDTSFPKGVVFNEWLGTVKALNGTQIPLSAVAESVSTVTMPETQRWIYDPSNSDVKYLSFLTPIGGIPIKATDAGETTAQYCGKAVFSDLHAGGSPAGNVPTACAGPPLTAQLKALEFLFFDLSACVSNDSLPPPSPPPPTK
jgi:hypothetical protein